MAATKKKITITIDCDLYDSAKSKYDNISGRVNELLSMDLYGSDEKSELIDRLHELKLEEKSITKRISSGFTSFFMLFNSSIKFSSI